MYADTDFFLALLKEKDWLKENAEKILEGHKGSIWTSIVTVTELFLIAKKYNLDPIALCSSLLSICEVKGAESDLLLRAAHYMKKGLGVFDAFHASYAFDGEIVSSDKVFDSIKSLKRVRLEKD